MKRKSISIRTKRIRDEPRSKRREEKKESMRMFIHLHTDVCTRWCRRAKLKNINRHVTVSRRPHRNRKNDRIRLNYVFPFSGFSGKKGGGGEGRRKTHRGFSTNETFGVYLSRRGPFVFRSAGSCPYGWGKDGKGRTAEEERFVFITRAAARVPMDLGRRLLRVWRPGVC